VGLGEADGTVPVLSFFGGVGEDSALLGYEAAFVSNIGEQKFSKNLEAA
jgi:hypothetical protein